MIKNVKKLSAKSIKTALPKIAVGIMSLAGVGYFSSVLTQQQCENAEAQSLVNGQMGGRPFYVIVGDEASQNIFSRVGAKFTSYTVVRHPNLPPGKSRISRFTWPDGKVMPHIDKGGQTASVSNVRIVLPFLASVDHVAVYGSLGADGSTSYYLCLFGLPIKIREETSWVS